MYIYIYIYVHLRIMYTCTYIVHDHVLHSVMHYICACVHNMYMYIHYKYIIINVLHVHA